MTVPTNNEEDREALMGALDKAYPYTVRQGGLGPAADAILAAGFRRPPVSGDTSDGHHTFDELYDYRMLYNAHAAQGWLAAGISVVKSWRHSDGELAFGGGWFVVSAQLPTGQVTNHYKTENWDLFDVPEVEQAPTWDGHSPAIAAERLRAALSTSRPREVEAVEVTVENSPTLAVHAEAARFGYTLSSTEAAHIAEAAIAASGLRGGPREAAPSDTDRETAMRWARDWLGGPDEAPEDYAQTADSLLAAGFSPTSQPPRVEVTDTSCPACQGVGGYWAERWEPCSACNGTGRQAAALGGGDQ